MDIVVTFIIIVLKIGLQGQRRQTTTYIFHHLHKKVTPPHYKGKHQNYEI